MGAKYCYLFSCRPRRVCIKQEYIEDDQIKLDMRLDSTQLKYLLIGEIWKPAALHIQFVHIGYYELIIS